KWGTVYRRSPKTWSRRRVESLGDRSLVQGVLEAQCAAHRKVVDVQPCEIELHIKLDVSYMLVRQGAQALHNPAAGAFSAIAGFQPLRQLSADVVDLQAGFWLLLVHVVGPYEAKRTSHILQRAQVGVVDRDAFDVIDQPNR